MLGILSGSVVAKINFKWAGGSSTILRKASIALVDNWCASSMIINLNRDSAGANTAVSRSARTSSTPLLLAASSSSTSKLPTPFGANATHELQTPHGVAVGP
ncbi:unannotated protein [freshwater metagenome]|uniref:Unannotated protein n=1 Tax=freshwater metagenome TaxID=449393 RepID=A0A6J6EMZ2_9ZZZZ